MIARDILSVLALVAVVGGTAHAQPATPRWITDPVWSHKPTFEQISSLYPKDAQAKNMAGSAVLKCTATANGQVKDCRPLSELPVGYGFAEAAAALSGQFTLDMQKSKPDPQEGAFVLMSVRFLLGEYTPPILRVQPGDNATLVTVAKGPSRYVGQTIPCPSADQPGRLCQAHAIEWQARPSAEEAETILAESDQRSGVSMIECSVGADAILERCKMGGATPAAEAALQRLAAAFRAPAEATDKTPTAKGRVLLAIDWTIVNELKGWRPSAAMLDAANKPHKKKPPKPWGVG